MGADATAGVRHQSRGCRVAALTQLTAGRRSDEAALDDRFNADRAGARLASVQHLRLTLGGCAGLHAVLRGGRKAVALVAAINRARGAARKNGRFPDLKPNDRGPARKANPAKTVTPPDAHCPVPSPA